MNCEMIYCSRNRSECPVVETFKIKLDELSGSEYEIVNETLINGCYKGGFKCPELNQVN